MANSYLKSTAFLCARWYLGTSGLGTILDVKRYSGALILTTLLIRSVKWLARIKAIAEPRNAPVQKKEYLYYSPQAGKNNATYSSGFSIQDMPVSSAIMYPVDKAVSVHDGRITMRGWAYGGGGHWPVRVEVSGDGGSVWYEVPYNKMSPKYYHAWRCGRSTRRWMRKVGQRWW